MPTGTPATVIICAGQSNTQGLAEKANFPANLQAPQSNVDGAGHGVYIWNPTAEAWQIIEMGVNDLSNTSATGCVQIPLGRQLAQEIGDDVYFVKRTQVGTNVYANWAPIRPEPVTGFNILYCTFLERVFNSFSQIGKPVGRVIFSTLRGEAEANDLARAQAHGGVLSAWYAALQSALGADFPIYFLESGLTPLSGNPYWAEVNASVLSIAGHEYDYAGNYTNFPGNNQRVFYVKADPTAWTKLADGVHYDAAGLENIADQQFRCIRDYIL